MTNLDGVRIDLEDIMSALERNGFDEVRVEFVPESGGHTNAAQGYQLAVRAVEESAGVVGIYAEPPNVSLAGFSVRLKSLESEQAIEDWLASFAGALHAAGLSGLLHATPTVRLPSSVTDFTEPWLSTFVAFDGEFAGTGADSSRAAAWCEHAVVWAVRSGGQIFVSSDGMSQPDTSGETTQHLFAALHARSLVQVACVDDADRYAAYLGFNADGSAVYQSYSASASLSERVARAREVLVAGAAQTRLGFVALMPKRGFGWRSRSDAMPTLRAQAANSMRNSPVWGRYVPDVHGMQLLTDEHLSRLPALEGWALTEVAPGRHLVETLAVAEWFGPLGPSEALVAQARADFEPILLTDGHPLLEN